jgi:hypothetical protein
MLRMFECLPQMLLSIHLVGNSLPLLHHINVTMFADSLNYNFLWPKSYVTDIFTMRHFRLV